MDMIYIISGILVGLSTFFLVFGKVDKKKGACGCDGCTCNTPKKS